MEYDLEKKNTRRCLECGEEITVGRSDRKFCCTECRNAYHNFKTHKIRALHTRILRSLDKNYQILDTLCKLGITSVQICDIVMSGFTPACFTSCKKEKNHRIYFCFDIKYSLTDSKVFNIGR